jgi:hypothetical protein
MTREKMPQDNQRNKLHNEKESKNAVILLGDNGIKMLY